MSTTRCAIVIDPSLPLGVIANTAAVLTLSLGRHYPNLIGGDLEDSTGDTHLGITTIAIPILKGSGERLRQMRKALRRDTDQLTVIDLIGATRTTRNYADYAQAMRETPANQLDYLGLALCGPSKLVSRYTGSLGLLR